MALDGGIGDQQLSAAVLVNITIVDVNNKPPVLLEPGVVHVMENTQVSLDPPKNRKPFLFLFLSFARSI